VATERQRSANQANAGRSTGPRTRAGKAVASGNARRHGLAAAVSREPGADTEIERLARAIADEASRPDLVGLARRIAERRWTSGASGGRGRRSPKFRGPTFLLSA
jgi:hypothetical protein